MPGLTVVLLRATPSKPSNFRFRCSSRLFPVRMLLIAFFSYAVPVVWFARPAQKKFPC